MQSFSIFDYFYSKKLQILSLVIATIITFCFAINTLATSVIMLSDEDLIVSVRAIVQGEVSAIESRFSEDKSQIYTYITVKVKKVLKGKIESQEIVTRQLGGTVGDIGQEVYGAPSFYVGEKVLLYLNTADDGALRVAHLFMGKFSIVHDSQNNKKYVKRFVNGVSIVANTQDPITNEMELSLYEAKIKNTLINSSQRVAEFDKLNANRPLLAVPIEFTSKSHSSHIQPNFTFFSPPARHFEADTNTAVPYQLNPDSAPVTGGGLSQFNSGLAAWTNVSSASITLQNGGMSSACGQVNDGINVVSFGDCRNEIDDPVNCTGTLAIGGYFRNSETKVVNGTTFFRIVDANVTFNNNFECFLSNSANLTEVMTHEIGHSIGLGHSSEDPNEPNATLKDAIMFFRAHGDGRGASLRSDDIMGVSFIYPTNSGPTQDFSLSLSPSSLTVNPGSTANFTLNRTNIGGFSGNINIAVSGLPPGATNGLPSTFNYPVTLPIITSNSTPTGSYTITVTGTSGSLVHSVTATLNVTQGPNFSFSISPASQTVSIGGTADYMLAITTSGGFSSPINFSFSNLPPGSNVPAFQGQSPIPFSVVTSSSTPAGTYTFTVTGTGGGITQSATAVLVVQNIPSSVRLNVNQFSTTVLQGQIANYPVSIDRTNFTGPVNLSLTILSSTVPPGITFSYSQNPTTSSSVTLNINTTTATPAGTYMFVAKGTASGITVSDSAPFALVVNQAQVPDFSLSLAPSSLTVQSGQTANYTLGRTNSGGFTGSVTISISGLPSGATDGLPNSFDFPVTLPIITSNTTPAGTYTITVTGTGGGLTRSTSATLIVQSAPASASLNVNQQSATVVQGQTANYPVSINRTNFTGAINLDLVILSNTVPPGITFGYSQNPTTSSNVTLSINTTTATPAGTYMFVAKGTASGITVSDSAAFALVVNQAQQQDFSLSLSPSSLTINSGDTANYTLSRTNIGGFTGNIAVSVSGLPPGATSGLPSSFTFPVTLPIITRNTTPAGTYTITVTGTGGGLTRSTSATLIVQAAAKPVINTVNYAKPLLTVTGTNFDISTRVFINNTEVSNFIKNLSSTMVLLKGNKKKLALKASQNEIKILSNGIESNTFVFSLFADKDQGKATIIGNELTPMNLGDYFKNRQPKTLDSSEDSLINEVPSSGMHGVRKY